MVDIDANSTQVKAGIADSQNEDHENENENESYEEHPDNEKLEGTPAGIRTQSPARSCSSRDSDDEPEETPSLSKQFPDSKLLVYPLQKIYSCLKCKDILREPVQVKACGHRLCYQCHEDIRGGSARCPEDQMELGNRKPRIDKTFKKEIDRLEVKCKQSKQGCTWEGFIEDFPGHMQFCNYNEMVCVCGAVFPKQKRQKHRDTECPKELIQCQHCRAEIPRETMTSHMDECPKRLLPCPNKCDKDLLIPRDELDKHIETECLRTRIMCDFEDVGCSYKTSREKMLRHYNKDLTKHLRLLHGQETQHDQFLNKIFEKLTMHEHMLLKEDERIENLENIAHSQVIWKIEDYSGKMHQAKAGNGETLFHPPFTTSKHGYRLSASVCLNGDGQAKGTHMSVFVCVHKGDYDVFLKWPFHHRVTFSLLDQNENPDERKHIKVSIKPNATPDNLKFLGRPASDKNASFGMSTFAKHDEVESRNYIKDNTILLKITVDCAGTDAVLLA